MGEGGRRRRAARASERGLGGGGYAVAAAMPVLVWGMKLAARTSRRRAFSERIWEMVVS